jgi:myo-inositol-1(or 4)-monophosphatase
VPGLEEDGDVPVGTTVDLEQARGCAVDLAEAAGSLVRAGAGTDVRVRTKGPLGDLVTDLDEAAEQLIVTGLRSRYPDHTVIAEESGVRPGADADWTWLVDPLDGTNNLAIGLHAYVVGIALCERGVPVVGVVHDPIDRSTWSAVQGKGLRGPRSARDRDRGSMILGWTQGHDVLVDPAAARTAKRLRERLEAGSARMLQLWAPLLCWVLLARGDIDGFVGFHAEGVDLPAGLLLAVEAGLVVRGFDGSPFDGHLDVPSGDRNFVAGRAEIVDDLCATVRETGLR